MAFLQTGSFRYHIQHTRKNLNGVSINSRPSTLARRTLLQCNSQHTFLLYTKPECPLCDGLQVKLQGLIDRAQFMPSFLTGATLQVRDISTNEAWQDTMHMSVPVLAMVNAAGYEVVLPRPPPRITADRLQRHLQEAISQQQEQS